MSESTESHGNDGLAPGPEPLTPDEKEAYLARARAEGRTLTEDELTAIFEPSIEPAVETAIYDDVEEMEPAQLDEVQRARIESNFFADLGNEQPRAPVLLSGLIFDFDDTLAYLTRPQDELLEEGARSAEAYMRSRGMELPDDFYTNIIEARRFALKKSNDEQEEHIANDAMSFLLQFFGYPASKMDPDVLRTAVDVFYAPEMTAWALRPDAADLLAGLKHDGYRLALLANYPCDRVFQRIVDYLAMRPYFDLCISSAGVEYRKPDEQFFNLALDRWDTLAYETVVIGDSLAHDIRGGINLGALTVQVQGTVDPQMVHENAELAATITPDAMIDSLAEIRALVEQWR